MESKISFWDVALPSFFAVALYGGINQILREKFGASERQYRDTIIQKIEALNAKDSRDACLDVVTTYLASQNTPYDISSLEAFCRSKYDAGL